MCKFIIYVIVFFAVFMLLKYLQASYENKLIDIPVAVICKETRRNEIIRIVQPNHGCVHVN